MANKVKNPETEKEKDNTVYSPEDVRKIHDEAYKQGFGDGFDKRGELESEDFEDEENPEDEEPE